MIFRADSVTPAVSVTHNGAGFHHPRSGRVCLVPFIDTAAATVETAQPALVDSSASFVIIAVSLFLRPPDVHGGFFFSRHFRRAAEKYFLRACCRTLAQFAFDPYFYGAKRTFCPLKNFSKYPLYTPRGIVL